MVRFVNIQYDAKIVHKYDFWVELFIQILFYLFYFFVPPDFVEYDVVSLRRLHSSKVGFFKYNF